MRLLCLALAGAALAGCSHRPLPDGGAVLLRMYEREHSGCFQVLESSEIVGSGQPYTVLSRRMQNGEAQTIIPADAEAEAGLRRVQNGPKTYRYMPDARRLEEGTIPPSTMDKQARLALVKANYNAYTLSEARVAGRPAYVVELRSIYPGRPRYRFWVDRDTQHRLRMEGWSPSGRLQSVTQALEPPKACDPSTMKAMLPGPGDPTVKSVRRNVSRKMDEKTLQAAVGFPLARITRVPAGFKTLGSYLFTCGRSMGPCARWDMTDGVVTVSLIQTASDIGSNESIRTPDDLRGPMVMTQKKGYHFVVHGNLLRDELQHIANGIVVP